MKLIISLSSTIDQETIVETHKGFAKLIRPNAVTIRPVVPGHTEYSAGRYKLTVLEQEIGYSVSITGPNMSGYGESDTLGDAITKALR